MDNAVDGKYFLEPRNDFTRRYVNKMMSEILKQAPEWIQFSNLYLQNRVKVIECSKELLNKIADALRRDFRLKFAIWSLVGDTLKMFQTSSQFKMSVEKKAPEGKPDRQVRYNHSIVSRRTMFARHCY